MFVAGSRAQVAFEAIKEKFQLSFSDYLLLGGIGYPGPDHRM
jgi:hypothetical protein